MALPAPRVASVDFTCPLRGGLSGLSFEGPKDKRPVRQLSRSKRHRRESRENGIGRRGSRVPQNLVKAGRGFVGSWLPRSGYLGPKGPEAGGGIGSESAGEGEREHSKEGRSAVTAGTVLRLCHRRP